MPEVNVAWSVQPQSSYCTHKEHFNYVKYGFICGTVELFKVKNYFAFKREQPYLLFAKNKECRLLVGYHGSHFPCSLLSLPQTANKSPSASRHLSGIQPVTQRLCGIFIDWKDSAQEEDKKGWVGRVISPQHWPTQAKTQCIACWAEVSWRGHPWSVNASRHLPARVMAVAQPVTVTHPAIIGPDKGAHHQHGPDKHYSQMTAYRSVLATVWHIALPPWIQ